MASIPLKQALRFPYSVHTLDPSISVEAMIEKTRRVVKTAAFGEVTIPGPKQALAQINALRLHWVFTSLLLETMSSSYKDSGTKETFATGMKGLSVGVYYVRFCLEMGLLFKHVFFPREHEKDFSRWERFTQELDKRHCTLMNDAVWGTTNLLTNFRSILNFAQDSPVPDYIVAVLLGFDMALLGYKYYRDNKEYTEKKARWTADLEHYTSINHQLMIDQTNEKLRKLERDWMVQKDQFYFTLSAANLFLGGFLFVIAGTLGAVSALSIVGAVVTFIASSMYRICNNIKLVYEKTLLLKEATTEQEKTKLENELKLAKKELYAAVFQNILLAPLAISALVLPWQLTVVIAVISLFTFFAFKIYKHFSQENQAKLPQDETSMTPTDRPHHTLFKPHGGKPSTRAGIPYDRDQPDIASLLSPPSLSVPELFGTAATA